MDNGWTPEWRRRQAELIRSWKPWEKSTGPKTTEGKSKVANTAWRGGHKAQLRALSKMVNEELSKARELGESRRTIHNAS